MFGSFKSEAIVNDEGKDRCGNHELQAAVDGVFHVVVWVFGWPSRLGWVNSSGYLSGVNP